MKNLFQLAFFSDNWDGIPRRKLFQPTGILILILLRSLQLFFVKSLMRNLVEGEQCPLSEAAMVHERREERLEWRRETVSLSLCSDLEPSGNI